MTLRNNDMHRTLRRAAGTASALALAVALGLAAPGGAAQEFRDATATTSPPVGSAAPASAPEDPLVGMIETLLAEIEQLRRDLAGSDAVEAELEQLRALEERVEGLRTLAARLSDGPRRSTARTVQPLEITPNDETAAALAREHAMILGADSDLAAPPPSPTLRLADETAAELAREHAMILGADSDLAAAPPSPTLRLADETAAELAREHAMILGADSDLVAPPPSPTLRLADETAAELAREHAMILGADSDLAAPPPSPTLRLADETAAELAREHAMILGAEADSGATPLVTGSLALPELDLATRTEDTEAAAPWVTPLPPRSPGEPDFARLPEPAVEAEPVSRPVLLPPPRPTDIERVARTAPPVATPQTPARVRSNPPRRQQAAPAPRQRRADAPQRIAPQPVRPIQVRPSRALPLPPGLRP